MGSLMARRWQSIVVFTVSMLVFRAYGTTSYMCDLFDECGDCVADECIWCAATNRCVLYGSSEFTSCATKIYDYGDCAGSDSSELSCFQYTDCSDCTMNGCSWCDEGTGYCLDDDPVCENRYLTCPSICASSSFVSVPSSFTLEHIEVYSTTYFAVSVMTCDGLPYTGTSDINLRVELEETGLVDFKAYKIGSGLYEGALSPMYQSEDVLLATISVEGRRIRSGYTNFSTVSPKVPLLSRANMSISTHYIEIKFSEATNMAPTFNTKATFSCTSLFEQFNSSKTLCKWRDFQTLNVYPWSSGESLTQGQHITLRDYALRSRGGLSTFASGQIALCSLKGEPSASELVFTVEGPFHIKGNSSTEDNITLYAAGAAAWAAVEVKWSVTCPTACATISAIVSANEQSKFLCIPRKHFQNGTYSFVLEATLYGANVGSGRYVHLLGVSDDPLDAFLDGGRNLTHVLDSGKKDFLRVLVETESCSDQKSSATDAYDDLSLQAYWSVEDFIGTSAWIGPGSYSPSDVGATAQVAVNMTVTTDNISAIFDVNLEGLSPEGAPYLFISRRGTFHVMDSVSMECMGTHGTPVGARYQWSCKDFLTQGPCYNRTSEYSLVDLSKYDGSNLTLPAGTLPPSIYRFEVVVDNGTVYAEVSELIVVSSEIRSDYAGIFLCNTDFEQVSPVVNVETPVHVCGTLNGADRADVSWKWMLLSESGDSYDLSTQWQIEEGAQTDNVSSIRIQEANIAAGTDFAILANISWSDSIILTATLISARSHCMFDDLQVTTSVGASGLCYGSFDSSFECPVSGAVGSDIGYVYGFISHIGSGSDRVYLTPELRTSRVPSIVIPSNTPSSTETRVLFVCIRQSTSMGETYTQSCLETSVDLPSTFETFDDIELNGFPILHRYIENRDCVGAVAAANTILLQRAEWLNDFPETGDGLLSTLRLMLDTVDACWDVMDVYSTLGSLYAVGMLNEHLGSDSTISSTQEWLDLGDLISKSVQTLNQESGGMYATTEELSYVMAALRTWFSIAPNLGELGYEQFEDTMEKILTFTSLASSCGGIASFSTDKSAKLGSVELKTVRSSSIDNTSFASDDFSAGILVNTSLSEGECTSLSVALVSLSGEVDETNAVCLEETCYAIDAPILFALAEGNNTLLNVTVSLFLGSGPVTGGNMLQAGFLQEGSWQVGGSICSIVDDALSSDTQITISCRGDRDDESRKLVGISLWRTVTLPGEPPLWFFTAGALAVYLLVFMIVLFLLVIVIILLLMLKQRRMIYGGRSVADRTGAAQRAGDPMFFDLNEMLKERGDELIKGGGDRKAEREEEMETDDDLEGLDEDEISIVNIFESLMGGYRGPLPPSSHPRRPTDPQTAPPPPPPPPSGVKRTWREKENERKQNESLELVARLLDEIESSPLKLRDTGSTGHTRTDENQSIPAPPPPQPPGWKLDWEKNYEQREQLKAKVEQNRQDVIVQLMKPMKPTEAVSEPPQQISRTPVALSVGHKAPDSLRPPIRPPPTPPVKNPPTPQTEPPPLRPEPGPKPKAKPKPSPLTIPISETFEETKEELPRWNSVADFRSIEPLSPDSTYGKVFTPEEMSRFHSVWSELHQDDSGMGDSDFQHGKGVEMDVSMIQGIEDVNLEDGVWENALRRISNATASDDDLKSFSDGENPDIFDDI